MNNLNTYLKNIEDNIGRKIYRHRTILGISQVDLARLVGVSSQQIAKYERGMNRISTSRLSIIAQLLQKNIDYFCEDVVEDIEIPEKINNSQIYRSLLQKISKLENKKQQQALSILIDGLVK